MDAFPHDSAAEAGVLGSLLQAPGLADEVADVLRPVHFYHEEHRLLYAAMLSLGSRGLPVDPLLLRQELQRRGEFDRVGVELLGRLFEDVPSPAHGLHYARIVREMASRRDLLHVGHDLIQRVSNMEERVDAIVDRAERQLLEAATLPITEPIPVSSILPSVAGADPAADSGLPTGYQRLDEMTGGLQPGHLVIAAGRPSMGKTSLALNVAAYVAVDKAIPVAIFSLEMDSHTICRHLLCLRAGIDATRQRRGTLNSESRQRQAHAYKALQQAPLHLDDTSTLTNPALRRTARRLKSRHGIRLLVVDYVQLLISEDHDRGRAENRQQEISQISRGLKALARELSISVLALSQLNRQVEARDGHRPRLADLRESGALEQDADLVLLLYRDDYYNPQSVKPGLTEIIVAKNRCGPTGQIDLIFRPECLRFDEPSARPV